jgi:uncharacterized membrane protein
MEAKTVDVSRGIAWFTGGWQIFMKNPGLWIVLGVITLIIAVALFLLPFVGMLALSLLMPVFAAGLLYAAREADEGRTLDVAHLFQGFREKDRLTPLLSLGGVALAGTVVSLALFIMIGGGSMLAMMAGGQREMMGGAIAGMLLALPVVLGVQLLVALALIYAVPLVMFRGVPASQAMGSSLRANLRNILPLLVSGVLYLFVAVLATLPLLLGWLVLLPVSVGMLYRSYKDLYEPA